MADASSSSVHGALRRFAFVAAVLIAGSAIAGAYAFGLLSDLRSGTLGETAPAAQRAQLLERIGTELGHGGATGAFRTYLMTGSQDARSLFEGHLEAARQAIGSYRSLAQSEAQRRGAQDLSGILEVYSGAMAQLGRNDTPGIIPVARLENALAILATRLESLHRLEQRTTGAQVDTVVWVAAGVIGASVLALIIISLWAVSLVRTHTVQSLSRLSRDLYEAANSEVPDDPDTADPLWGETRRDEVGAVARAAALLRRKVWTQSRRSAEDGAPLSVTLHGAAGTLFEEVMTELRCAGHKLTEDGERLTKTAGELSAATARTGDRLEITIDRVASTWNDISENTAKAKREITGNLQTIVQNAERLSTRGQEMDTAARSLTGELRLETKAISDLTTRLGETLDGIQSKIDRTQSDLAAVTTAAEGLVESLADRLPAEDQSSAESEQPEQASAATVDWQRLESVAASLEGSLATLGSDLRGGLSGAQDSIAAAVAALQGGQEGFADLIAKAEARLRDTSDRLAGKVDTLSQEAESVRRSMGAAVESVEQAAAGFAGEQATVKALWADLQAQGEAAREAVAGVTAALGQGGGSLNAAIAQLHQAAEDLRSKDASADQAATAEAVRGVVESAKADIVSRLEARLEAVQNALAQDKTGSQDLAQVAAALTALKDGMAALGEALRSDLPKSVGDVVGELVGAGVAQGLEPVHAYIDPQAEQARAYALAAEIVAGVGVLIEDSESHTGAHILTAARRVEDAAGAVNRLQARVFELTGALSDHVREERARPALDLEGELGSAVEDLTRDAREREDRILRAMADLSEQGTATSEACTSEIMARLGAVQDILAETILQTAAAQDIASPGDVRKVGAQTSEDVAALGNRFGESLAELQSALETRLAAIHTPSPDDVAQELAPFFERLSSDLGTLKSELADSVGRQVSARVGQEIEGPVAKVGAQVGAHVDGLIERTRALEEQAAAVFGRIERGEVIDPSALAQQTDAVVASLRDVAGRMAAPEPSRSLEQPVGGLAADASGTGGAVTRVTALTQAIAALEADTAALARRALETGDNGGLDETAAEQAITTLLGAVEQMNAIATSLAIAGDAAARKTGTA